MPRTTAAGAAYPALLPQSALAAILADAPDPQDAGDAAAPLAARATALEARAARLSAAPVLDADAAARLGSAAPPPCDATQPCPDGG
ncbi:hypothetical protein [Oceanibium sediminis]|uniref:hypothetical protein n=1 Tax=Oceanibium sediminis TaxID=2026339 RepID=UPI0018E59CE3|nr:hypothetical protein [Oceanibium sediminis]